MVNWKKAAGVTALSTSILFSSFAPMFGVKSVPTVSAESTAEIDSTILPFAGQHHSGPFDIGMVNEEKVLEALVKEGVINGDLSLDKQYDALRDYLTKRAMNAKDLALDEKELYKLREGAQKQKGIDPESAASMTLAGDLSESNWSGDVRTDKALVLLIEFPDYQHNSITEEEGPVLLYDDFSSKHYENMIFNEDGYVGPNGEDFMSLNEFYIEQSGGSYKVEGQASKWYMAEEGYAYYGANDPQPDGNDANPGDLIKEALIQAAQDPDINLAEYDQLDPMDINGDGNILEPDGIIDNLMVVHAGIGEEAGGGSLGGDAIWSHKSSIFTQEGTELKPWVIPGTDLSASNYMIMPEDGAAGVFAHEYGHGLGLPDEYDSQYTALGSTTGNWSIMSGGSWNGIVPGTEPVGFSAYAKEYLQDTMPGSNWFKDVEYSLEEIQAAGGVEVVLDQASVKGENADAVKISLPDKVTTLTTPEEGEFAFYGGKGNEIDNEMVATIDLSDATESVTLDYDVWFDIEYAWDYAFVQVSEDGGESWQSLSTPNTTDEVDPSAYPSIPVNVPGYTGNSEGWIHETVDLTAYAGKEIQLKFRYITDWASTLEGIFVDDVRVTADGNEVFADGAEGSEGFALDGFVADTGTKTTAHYYLLEWRNYTGSDTALQHAGFGANVYAYDPGLVIWYVDEKYDDNWVANHPGEGFLNVVDAHRYLALWHDMDPNDETDFGPEDNPAGYVVDAEFQIADAAYSLNETTAKEIDLSYLPIDGRATSLDSLQAASKFDDSENFLLYDSVFGPDTIEYPYVGTMVPHYGLKIHVVDQAEDMSTGTVMFHIGDQTETDASLVELERGVYSAQEGTNEVVVSGTLHNDSADSFDVTIDVTDSEGNVIDTVAEQYEGSARSFEKVITVTEDYNSGDYTVVVSVNDVEVGTLAFSVDNTAPVIEVLGDNPLEVEVGSQFEDPGVTATDNVDGDVTSSVVTVSDVDVDTVGEYTVTYSVVDSLGNEAVATRTVNVVDSTPDNGDGDNGDDEGTGDEDEGDTDNGEGATDDEDDNGTGADNDKGTGEEKGGNLPDTATNLYNWLLAGGFLLAAGAVLLYIQRKRKVAPQEQ
ncbi:immune inhibitor A domain-containing protein [Salirhabdus sp. Marseille-P4669]|uniref:immune inhibitor A domain-containing protein n=1 Tax=Salirhabdus sp. Marseille-P4669 TaxID=2042310 RepID=UPI000C7B0D95|nr:immune inhibitor A domain-containing protein [Salirhabdus sp. Marseille-P4669]